MAKRKPRGISTTELADLLGISIDTLYRLKEQGIFKRGPKCHYWKVNPIAARPTYRWNKELCLKTWDELEQGDYG